MKLDKFAFTPAIAAIVVLLTMAASAAPKIVYVAPGGMGDGSSWEDAMGSVSNACASAAAFAEGGFDLGEVWIKTGRYTITNQIDIHSHVTVRGGFAGGETDPSQADPKKNLTILSGDMYDDNYWRPNDGDPAAADRVPIWSGEGKMTYNPPNPDRKDTRWVPWRTGSGHDYGHCFVGSDALTEDCRFYGITFTGFRYSAVKIGAWIMGTRVVDESMVGRGIVISNCFFFANATSGGDCLNNGPVQLYNTECAISDCTFDGNYVSMTIRTGLTPITNTLRRCTFSNGCSLQFNPYDSNPSNAWIIADCDFYRNYAGANGNIALIYFDQVINCGDVLFNVVNCRFRENWMSGKVYALFNSSGSYGGAWQQFINCDFHANLSTNATSSTVSACVWGSSTTRRWYFRGCSFRENAVVDYGVEGGRAAVVFGSATANNYAYFVDCTVQSNSIATAQGAAVAKVGTVLLDNTNTRLFSVGCIFKDNALDVGEAAKAELKVDGPGSNGQVTLINTVLYDESDDYVPIVVNSESTPYLHNCYISKFDATTAGCKTFGRCEGVSATNEPVFAEFKKGPFANWALGLTADSPYSKAGSTVKIADFDRSVTDNGSRIEALEYTPEFVKNRNWKRIFQGSSATMTDADAAARGITLDSPLVADAFGDPRKARRVAYGPLRRAIRGLMLLLR